MLELCKVGIQISESWFILHKLLDSKLFLTLTLHLYDGLNMWLTVLCEQRVISNEHGEKLVGLLHQTSSKKLVILCHGFRATKASPYHPWETFAF